jgi:hypothetical protein
MGHKEFGNLLIRDYTNLQHFLASVASGGDWQSLIYRCLNDHMAILCSVSSHLSSLYACLCSNFPLLLRTRIRLGPTLLWYDLNKINYICNPIPKKGNVLRFWGLRLLPIWDTIQPITGLFPGWGNYT